jgi:hypothetical protein
MYFWVEGEADVVTAGTLQDEIIARTEQTGF